MKCNMTVAIVLLFGSVAFAEVVPQSVMYFVDWIPKLDFDSTNDCYVARYNPTARMLAYVYREGSGSEPQKIHPGGTCILARSERAFFTQHARVGCALTYTNGMSEVNGVVLPAEFRDSPRQLLISGKVVSKQKHDGFEKYAFVVNADGEGYDVATRTKFHFGLAFHAPEAKTPPKINPGIESIQRSFHEEGVETYKKAFKTLCVQIVDGTAKEGVTNAVTFLWETGGLGNLSEKDRAYLMQRDPDAARLLAKFEASRFKDACVAFYTRDKDAMRIIAVARIFAGKEWHFWTYLRSGVPEFVFLGDGRGTAENYYEYGEDGLFRNFCLVSKRGINYHTLKDGMLQQSSDMQKAREFISMVEEIFRRYVELDTSGILKAFVEKVNSKPTPGR